MKELDKIERKLGSKKFRETFKTTTCDKGSDIGKFSPERIKMIEHWMNNYPRKIFGGLSSNMLLKQLLYA